MGLSDVSESLAQASAKVQKFSKFSKFSKPSIFSIPPWFFIDSTLDFGLRRRFDPGSIAFLSSLSRFYRISLLFLFPSSSYLAFTVLPLLHRLYYIACHCIACIILHLYAWDLAGARSLEGTYCHECHIGLVVVRPVGPTLGIYRFID
jgi:hypothetical protein